MGLLRSQIKGGVVERPILVIRPDIQRLTCHELARTSQRSPPPLTYVRFERYMEKAKLRLAGTTLPVREIARQLGFRNPVSFHHIFTREVGQPPGEYRRAAAAATV